MSPAQSILFEVIGIQIHFVRGVVIVESGEEKTQLKYNAPSLFCKVLFSFWQGFYCSRRNLYNQLTLKDKQGVIHLQIYTFFQVFPFQVRHGEPGRESCIATKNLASSAFRTRIVASLLLFFCFSSASAGNYTFIFVLLDLNRSTNAPASASLMHLPCISCASYRFSIFR